MTIAVLSGGLDSTVLVGHMLDMGHSVAALSVNYGQRHRRELLHAAQVCAHYGVDHEVVALPDLARLLSSSLTDDAIAVPDGHYAAESMKATIVPNRNAILLSIAAGYALTRGHNAVAFGAHAGDHFIYPDCRPEFLARLGAALHAGSEWPDGFNLWAPFVTMSKTAIVERGVQLGAPMELSWSCYKGAEQHCGTCGTCTERREAFADAGVLDPTEYLAVSA